MVQIAPRRTAVSTLGLMAAVAIFPTATALTSGLPCPDQANPCLQDLSCGACLLTLNADDNILADANFTECSEFYTDVCTVADDAGCDTTNPLLEDFFACIADEEFDCPDFVSCAAVADPSATLDPVGDTPAPVMTTAPTDMTEALTTTMAPSSVEGAEDAEDPEDPEETREANEDSGVSRTVAAAATRTAMALACGLALSYAV